MKLKLSAAQAAHSLAKVAIEYHQKGKRLEARAVVAQINRSLQNPPPSDELTRRISQIKMFCVKHRDIPEEYRWPPAFLCRAWMAQA